MIDPTYFTVIGPIDGVVQTLGWVEGRGFSDEETAGQAARRAVRLRDEVCATPTGPCYLAADKPAHVAFLTALSVFDRPHTGVRYEGDAIPEIERVLEELTRVPDGAVA